MSIDLNKVTLAANYCLSKQYNIVTDKFINLLGLTKDEEQAVADLMCAKSGDAEAKHTLTCYLIYSGGVPVETCNKYEDALERQYQYKQNYDLLTDIVAHTIFSL
jgi:hypothetical protein